MESGSGPHGAGPLRPIGLRLRTTPACAAEVKSLITAPSTTRFSSIWAVTNNFIPFVVATMSPNPTLVNTVTVKYRAVVVSSG